MPNGRGGTQTYSCQPCYRLILTRGLFHNSIRLGFVTHRLQLLAASQRYGRKYYVKVVSVTPIGTIPTTYCFTDPIRGRASSVVCPPHNVVNSLLVRMPPAYWIIQLDEIFSCQDHQLNTMNLTMGHLPEISRWWSEPWIM